MGHAPAAELESALADTVNAWWRQHLFHGGPRRPHTTADARAVAASMASLPVRQRNDAAAHFAQSGFPTDLLPARVPERRVLECEWITEKVGDEARPVVLHAYDIGDDWNGWAEPLFTAEQSARLHGGRAPRHARGRGGPGRCGPWHRLHHL